MSRSSDGRSIAHDALESMRFAAVRLHREGVSIETLSRSFKVTRSAIHNWIKRARYNGINSLRATKGTGRPSTIDEKQFKSLVHLMRQPATRHGYSTDLWSGPRVRKLIRCEFGVEYHRKHMPRLLQKLGLVLKFPERRALEQDPAALRKWKKERFPEISKFAKKKRALVFFKSVKEFVAQNAHWLRVEFLPAYSPELNPSEKPWRYINTKKMNANQARNKIELRQKAKTALSALKKDTKTLTSFLTSVLTKSYYLCGA